MGSVWDQKLRQIWFINHWPNSDIGEGMVMTDSSNYQAPKYKIHPLLPNIYKQTD